MVASVKHDWCGYAKRTQNEPFFKVSERKTL
jgi:hypothetical protein